MESDADGLEVLLSFSREENVDSVVCSVARFTLVLSVGSLSSESKCDHMLTEDCL